METTVVRALALTAVAPVAWGTTYLTTSTLLPADRPLFAAAVRALPAGLLLLAWRRRLPTGPWRWRAPLLAMCNIGLFFPLLFLSAYHLPGGLASTLQAASPLVLMAVAWVVLGERAGAARIVAATVGLAGVALLVLRQPSGVDPVGLLGAAGSVVVCAVGFVLVKHWGSLQDARGRPVDMVTLVSWQLAAGGLVLVPVAWLLEGPPPAIDGAAALGFVWLGGVGTVVAYTCWFRGLQRLPAGAVGLVGLLNPVTGTGLGVLVAGEAFGAPQAVGMALVLGGVALGQLSRRSP